MEQTLTISEQLEELGTLVDNQETAVQRVGARMVDKFISTWNEDSKPDMETTATMLHYLTEIQVRDYALGILDAYDADDTEQALAYLMEQAPTDSAYINAPAALLAQFYYEYGRTADAYMTLSNAQENYSLALLLFRVFKAGWEPEGFAKMRKELHPQVVANIFGEEE
jgi:hypothetical protein